MSARIVAVAVLAWTALAVADESPPIPKGAAKTDSSPPKKIPAEALDPSKARIEGVVVDESSGPVAGASVRVMNNERLTTATRADGTFRLVLDRPSCRYVSLLASVETGARQGVHAIAESPIGAVVSCRIIVKPSRALTVQTRDSRGKPVPQAAVGVFDVNLGLLTAETDATGIATLRVPVDAKIASVVAFKPGAGFDYLENYRSWPGGAVLPLPSLVKLKLAGAQAIRVTATDSSGKPLPGINLIPWSIHKKGKIAYVNLSGAASLKYALGRTDQHGVATFAWIPGDLQRGVTFLVRSEEYHLPNVPHFEPSQPDVPLTARLLRNVPVSGRVVLPDGKPAAGILIQAEGSGATTMYCRTLARTAADGSYRLQVYPDQSYIVAVTDDTWAAPSYTGVGVQEGLPRDDLHFQLTKGTLIRGWVTIGKAKKPGIDQTVTLFQNGTRQESLVRWAGTDKEGGYLFRVGPGDYELRGPGTESDKIKVQAQQTIAKDFHIDRLPRGPLSGTVRHRAFNGKPIADALVTGESINNSGHAGFEAVSDNQGRFQTERWRDRMHLYARNPEGNLATMMSIGEDEEEVAILLLEAAKLKGRIIDKNGKPVALLRITCLLSIGPDKNLGGRAYFSTTTDADGRFTLGGLVVGAQCSIRATPLGADRFATLKQFPVTEAKTMDLGNLNLDSSAPE